MPWKEKTTMTQRKEFVEQAIQTDRNMSQLCREFGISRKTGYKWLNRYLRTGEEGLVNLSRRPKYSPKRTSKHVEGRVLKLRAQHPAWGGRKLCARLKQLGYEDVPSPSTITAILHRHNRIGEKETLQRQRIQRFEKDRPNEMWQMDFKAPFDVGDKACTPLTILDDYSRYLICLQVCTDQLRETVEMHLTAVFRQYGLPETILTDNGSPWGPSSGKPYYTRLMVWLLRLGIRVIRSRPYHPQTLGKDERLHRSLKDEVLAFHNFSSFQECQTKFDRWQQIYNTQRPHEALDLKPPITRFQVSQRPFPEDLPPVEYPQNFEVRRAYRGGRISFRDHHYLIGKAFDQLPIGLVPSRNQANTMDVYFCKQIIKKITLK